MFLSRCKKQAALTKAFVPFLFVLIVSLEAPQLSFGDDFTPQAVQTSIDLQQSLNKFCWNMWKTYNDDSEEFYDAYREAYELLQLSSKIKSATMTGGSLVSVKRWILEIDSEVHHVEHHLEEFSENVNIPVANVEKVVSSLEVTEETLASLMDQLGMESHEHGEEEGHEDGHPQKVDLAKATISAGELHRLADGVCVLMYQKYNNQSLEFLDVYKETYELMLSAKSLKTKLEAMPDMDKVHELMAALDEKIHLVESHVSVFVGRSEAGNETAQIALLEKIDAVEIKLHSLKSQLVADDDHEKGHKHAETKIVYSGTTTDLALDLSVAATSLCRAIEHNYKKNPDFNEAFEEIIEFRDICKQIAGLISNDQISDQCKGLIRGLDGELHHLEEHVKHFTRDDNQSQDQFGRANRKLTQVEELLHALMERAGIKGKHVD